jgi:hypothetical protein
MLQQQLATSNHKKGGRFINNKVGFYILPILYASIFHN